ncbi:MAG: MarR family winged helix-turn-helix transcriptional regulator [Planctomycetia bacterium]
MFALEAASAKKHVMVGKLQFELKKREPFDSLAQEAGLNLVRTADLLQRGFADVFRAGGLSPSQYNVLRILRGAKQTGAGDLPCHEIAERMISRDPDVTRLLDRLERMGLIERDRSPLDRRVVLTRITPAGEELLAPLDSAVLDLHRKQLAALGDEKLRTLIDLLEEIRGFGPPAARNGQTPEA